VWKLLDAVENNTSLIELFIDQKTELNTSKLLYKLCEFFTHNKYLQKLTLTIPIPPSIVYFIKIEPTKVG